MLNEDEKTCPYCGETIKKVAIKCKHCQSDLFEVGEKESETNRGAKNIYELEKEFFEKNPKYKDASVFFVIFILLVAIMYAPYWLYKNTIGKEKLNSIQFAVYQCKAIQSNPNSCKKECEIMPEKALFNNRNSIVNVTVKRVGSNDFKYQVNNCKSVQGDDWICEENFGKLKRNYSSSGNSFVFATERYMSGELASAFCYVRD